MSTYGKGEWRMRNGGKVVVTEDLGPKRLFRLTGLVDGQCFSWGIYGRASSSVETEFDLVAPWVEPAPDHIETEMQKGDTLIFTGTGVLNPRTDKVEDLLDVIASIRDEYLKKRRDALDQMEIHANQGDAIETSAYSTEAERHGASLLSANRILRVAQDFFDLRSPTVTAEPDPIDAEMQAWLAEVEAGPDAAHIARTNPARIAALIGWLKAKGVMK